MTINPNTSMEIGNVLDVLEKTLGIIFERMEINPNPLQYYHREYVYNLKALTKELRNEMRGGYFSLDYVTEKVNNLLICAREISNGRS